MACGSLGEAVGERGGSWVVGRGGGDGVRLVDVMEDCMGAVRARPRPQVCARGVQEKRHQLSISYSWIFI